MFTTIGRILNSIFGRPGNQYPPILETEEQSTKEEPTFAERIVRTMRNQNITLHTEDGQINIVYVVGVDPDGTPNKNRANAFDDARIVIGFSNGKPIILGAWEATVETGKLYTERPINVKGAARIAFGEHKHAWQVGTHHAGKSSAQEALIQAAEVSVYRDKNKDYDRTGDPIDTGYFGINQHHGYDFPKDDIRSSSAGCLVGRTRAGHKKFMSLVKSDPRWLADKNFLFSTTVLERVE